MLVVLSDTHGQDGPRLAGRTAEAVEAADVIIHAGDFMTESVLDAFDSYGTLYAVFGNNDPPAVRKRIPSDRIVDWAGLRIALVHGHEHSPTARTMFARQSSADLLVVGHSHEPGFEPGTVPTLNPGSHADPRWHRPAHAELEWDDASEVARGRLVDPEEGPFEEFVIEPRE